MSSLRQGKLTKSCVILSALSL